MTKNTLLSGGFIQVAGVIDRAEADMLIGAGVHSLGYPLRLPVNKEDLSEEAAGEIIRATNAQTLNVLITYLDKAEEVAGFCAALDVPAVQLHGDISAAELEKLGTLAPDVMVIKSLVVRGDNEKELELMVEALSPLVDAFITDTFDPRTGAEGATGKTHDWDISRRLVEMAARPVILAGGLNADNVCAAIEHVRPAGVDTHTGVEDKATGRKDPDHVRRFVQEARRGFDLIDL